jgi:DnaJ homolog subfamily A member 2
MEGSDIDNTRYYNTLGVRKDATQEQIRTNYVRLARTHQPELGGDPDLFKLIREAYNVLKDPSKRSLYDMYGESLAPLNESASGSSGANPFTNMFGGAGCNLFGDAPNYSAPPQPSSSSQSAGSNVEINVTKNLEVSLEEIYMGKIKCCQYERLMTPENFNFNIAQKCAGCNGEGIKNFTNNLGPGMVQQVRKE